MTREDLQEKLEILINGNDGREPLSETLYKKINKALDQGAEDIESYNPNFILPHVLLKAALEDHADSINVGDHRRDAIDNLKLFM